MKERRRSAISRVLDLRGQALIGTSRSFAEVVPPRGEQDVTGTSRTSAFSTKEVAAMDGVQWPAGGQPHACPSVGQTSPLVGSSFVRGVVESEGWPIGFDFRPWAHRFLVCRQLLLFSRTQLVALELERQTWFRLLALRWIVQSTRRSGGWTADRDHELCNRCQRLKITTESHAKPESSE